MKKILVANLFLVTSLESSLYGADLVGRDSTLRRENLIANLQNLVRIKDDKTLEEMKKKGELIPIPKIAKFDDKLDEKWQWVLPEAGSYWERIGIEFIERFGRMFQINSAVRTIFRQLEIMKTNFNAAAISGEKMSTHLTGATVDISKIGLGKEELNWLRRRFVSDEESGFLEATEENMQLCFHVMVFRTYTEKKSLVQTK